MLKYLGGGVLLSATYLEIYPPKISCVDRWTDVMK